MHLAEFLTHEQKLLAGMSHVKAIGSTQVLCLFLQGIPGHLANHRSLSVHHLIMGEYQNKVFAVGIEHTEG